MCAVTVDGTRIGGVRQGRERSARRTRERDHPDVLRPACSAALTTFGEFPLVEIAISTSPARPSDSTCRAKTPSTPKSFAIAVSSDESVVSAIAGIEGRGLSIVSVLTNSVARCWASAALPPFPQISSLPPVRSEAIRISAAAGDVVEALRPDPPYRLRGDAEVVPRGRAEVVLGHAVASRPMSAAMISAAAARSATTWSASSPAFASLLGAVARQDEDVVAPSARPIRTSLA